MTKFRVLVGRHYEGIETEGPRKGKARCYKKGDIVDSKTDLLKMNAPGAIKFEKVEETPRILDLSKLTEAKLRQLAADEEVDVASCKTKVDLIAAIQNALT